MSTIPTFRELAAEVLEQRDEQGVRGIARERSRYRVHVETADFIDRPVVEIAARDIRAWLRVMGAKNAFGTTRPLDRATINRAYSLRQRIRDAVLRHQARLPQLHDPVALLESVDGLISDYERRIERLEEEVKSNGY